MAASKKTKTGLPSGACYVGNMVRRTDLTYVRKDGTRVYAPPESPYFYKTPAGKAMAKRDKNRGHRGWYGEEGARNWCKERNEHYKELGLKIRCHVMKNPKFVRNSRVYPWLTYEE